MESTVPLDRESNPPTPQPSLPEAGRVDAPALTLPTQPDSWSIQARPALASRFLRFMAWMVDVSIVSVLCFVVSSLLGDRYFDPVFGSIAIFVATSIAYRSVFESSALRATPGKTLLGLVVLGHQGRRLSGGQAAWRALSRLVNFLTLMLPNLWLLLPGRVGFHDAMAFTGVYKAASVSAPPPGASRGLRAGWKEARIFRRSAIVISALLSAATITVLCFMVWANIGVRSVVADAYDELAPLRASIDAFAAKEGRMPSSLDEVGMGASLRSQTIRSIDYSPKTFAVVMHLHPEALLGNEGAVLMVRAWDSKTASARWGCRGGGQVRLNHLPSACSPPGFLALIKRRPAD